jgi:hypothetical protein
MIFWVATPCNLVKIYRSFEGTYRLRLQCRKVSQARNSSKSLLIAAFLLDLLLGPEDGGDTFFRMSVDFYRTTLHYKSKDRTLHNHQCENAAPILILYIKFSCHNVSYHTPPKRLDRFL